MNLPKNSYNSTPNEAYALKVMRFYCIKNHHIALQLGTNSHTVRRALDPNKFGSVWHKHVLSVRKAVEDQLRNAGWKGHPKELWDEFDKKVHQIAA